MRGNLLCVYNINYICLLSFSVEIIPQWTAHRTGEKSGTGCSLLKCKYININNHKHLGCNHICDILPKYSVWKKSVACGQWCSDVWSAVHTWLHSIVF